MSISQVDFDTNAKMKTMFIYNFTKYIEWPPENKQGDFIIGILGKSSLDGELDKLAATKKAVTQDIKIVHFESPSKITKSHMLFIPKVQSANITSAIKKIKGNNTLVITEQEGLAQKGAAINFVVRNNKLRFELNKSNISTYKLQVSSSLESLAIPVN